MAISCAGSRMTTRVPPVRVVVIASLTVAAALVLTAAPVSSLQRFSGAVRPGVFALAAAVVIAATHRFAPAGSRLVTMLAISLVLTGWQYDTGLIMLEPPLVAIMACGSFWLLDTVKRKKLRVQKLDVVGLWALLVVVAAWLSFFGAVDTMTWLKRAMRVTCLFGLYLYLVNKVSRREDVMAFIRGGLFACAVAALVLVEEVMELLYNGGLSDYFGPAGTFVNTNEAATYVALFVVIGTALYALGEYIDVMDRRAFIFTMSLSVVGVIVTRSRTGLAAVIVTPAVLFAWSRRVRRVLVAAAVFVVITSAAPLVRMFEDRVLGTFGMSGDEGYDEFVQTGNEERLYLLELYWNVIKAHPVFGIGAGNYPFIGSLGLDLPLPSARPGWTPVDPYGGVSSHNGFVSWWAEAGTVGLVPFVAALLCAGRLTWRAGRHRLLAPWWRAVGTGVLGALAVFVMTNLTGEFGVSQARYWVLLALASIVARHAKDADRRIAPIRC
jgi:O-antigen ligase